jgi:hypothetical protein
MQPVPGQDEGDWFGEAAAAQEAAPSYAPQYAQGGTVPSYPPAAQQYPPAAYSPAGYTPGGFAPGGAAPSQAAPAQAAYAAPPAPARRRLSPGWVAFIALDVVLVLALAVFAWKVLSGPGTAEEADGSPTVASTPDATPSDEATAAPEVLAQFASPSGNIVCAITSADVSCSIAVLNQQPAPFEGCEGTVGYRVTISADTGKVSLPCVPADAQPQPADAGMPKLEYTQSVTKGQFTCTSADTGMSCKDDETGKGFSIAKAGIGTF